MSTIIKSQMLFPRADLSAWETSPRVFKDGEIGIARVDGKFKLFGGVEGKTFAEDKIWLSADVDYSNYYTKEEISQISVEIAEDIAAEVISSLDFSDSTTLDFTQDGSSISADVKVGSITNEHIAAGTIVPENLSSSAEWIFDCN